jgi:hypothetical protein
MFGLLFRQFMYAVVLSQDRFDAITQYFPLAVIRLADAYAFSPPNDKPSKLAQQSEFFVRGDFVACGMLLRDVRSGTGKLFGVPLARYAHPYVFLLRLFPRERCHILALSFGLIRPSSIHSSTSRSGRRVI